MSVPTITKTFDLPKVFQTYWGTKKVAEKKITEATVLSLFQEEKISTSKGAELLDIPIQDFMDLLNEHGIPLEGKRLVITPKKSTREESIQNLKAVMRRVHEQNKGVSEEEVIKDVEQAVAKIRSEEYAKQKQSS